MSKKLSDKAIDKLVEKAYYARCSGIAISVLDIGKVFAVGRKAYSDWMNPDNDMAKADADVAIMVSDYVGDVVFSFVDSIKVG